MNWAMKPLTNKPSIWAKKAADTIDQPSAQSSRTFEPGGYLGQYEDFANKLQGQIKGGIAGGIEGAGYLLSSMTSPMSLLGSATGMAPWLKGAQQLTSLGNMAHRIPGPMKGVGPSVNIPELIAKGGEDVYNAGRSAYAPIAKSLEDVAYNTVRTGNDPIRKQIGGTFNLAEAMRRSNLR